MYKISVVNFLKLFKSWIKKRNDACIPFTCRMKIYSSSAQIKPDCQSYITHNHASPLKYDCLKRTIIQIFYIKHPKTSVAVQFLSNFELLHIDLILPWISHLCYLRQEPFEPTEQRWVVQCPNGRWFSVPEKCKPKDFFPI